MLTLVDADIMSKDDCKLNVFLIPNCLAFRLLNRIFRGKYRELFLWNMCGMDFKVFSSALKQLPLILLLEIIGEDSMPQPLVPLHLDCWQFGFMKKVGQFLLPTVNAHWTVLAVILVSIHTYL